MIRIGITGGIGSGKSVVSKILKLHGIDVYDCDNNAKRLQTENIELKNNIISLLGAESYIDNKLNKSYIASKIFQDKELLSKINEIVHPIVKADFNSWCKAHETSNKNCIVAIESAIMKEANIDLLVDEVWTVTAPEEVRLSRACKRDNADKEQILSRMRKQTISNIGLIIKNDNASSLIEQIYLRLDYLKDSI